MQHAVLAAEDRDFYEHGGFSPTGIGRAIWNNVSGGDLQGGSTITQQYAKNAFLTQERTVLAQGAGAACSRSSSRRRCRKDQILADYLNTIYFGRGAYGIEAASQQYFGKSVSELDLGQAAALAAIIRSPGNYDPADPTTSSGSRAAGTTCSTAWSRRAGSPPAQKASRRRSPSSRSKKPANRFGGTNGYLLDARAPGAAREGHHRGRARPRRLRVVSTFDKKAQRAAVKAVQDEAPTSGTKGLRIGLVAVKPGTGEVVAMYGGTDFLTSPINNATQAIGQAGSTFKPFALAAGVEDGVALDSVWNGDSGVTIDGYKVNNYGDRVVGRDHPAQGHRAVGELRLRRGSRRRSATTRSSTPPTRAGIPEDTAGARCRCARSRSASPRRTSSTSPGAYATFAARGQQVRPRSSSRRSRGPNGGVLFALDPTPKQAFDPEVADTVNYALQQGRHRRHRLRGARASAARPRARPARPTSNKSAWFAGYTPDLAAAVMFVKDGADGKPVSLSGVGGMNSRDRRLVPGAHLDRVHEGRARGHAGVRSSSARRTCPRPPRRRPRARRCRPPRRRRRPRRPTATPSPTALAERHPDADPDPDADRAPRAPTPTDADRRRRRRRRQPVASP